MQHLKLSLFVQPPRITRVRSTRTDKGLQPDETPGPQENKFSKTADAGRSHGGATQMAGTNRAQEI